MNKLNLVRLTLDVPYSKTSSTITATTSTKYRKGQDDAGVAQYYDLGGDGALLWTEGRLTVKEKSGKRVAVVAIDGVTHNGTTTDGRNKYILTVDTADDGSTLMTGLKQNDNGTNSVTNVDADLAVDQFPEGSTVEITWDTAGQNLLENSFTANSSTDTATAGEALAARKAVAIDSTDNLLYLFDDGDANHSLVGITDADYAISNTATYIRGGGRSTGHTGLTAGAQQFADTTTAGNITETNTGYPLGRANADGTAINIDLSSQADPATNAGVIAGTSTDLKLYNDSQLKLAVETHGATEREQVVLREEQASGTNGGTFTNGAWRTRVLNTEVIDTGANCTLSSNQFTLTAGTYNITARCPADNVGIHKGKLYNISDSTDVIIGSNSDAQSSVSTDSIVQGQFTIASSKTFEIQHRSSSTVATNGFGSAAFFSVVEVYTEVFLEKIA